MNAVPLCSRRDSAAEGFGGTHNMAMGWRRGSSHGAKRIDAPRVFRVQGSTLMKRSSYIPCLLATAVQLTDLTSF